MTELSRLVVTGTHSSGKNYLSRLLYELGFSQFIQEPLNPLSPPGVWMGKKDFVYTYCDSHSQLAKQALIKRKLFGLAGIPLFAKPATFRDYASLCKSWLIRTSLWSSGRSFVIKDPFCLFIADILKTKCGLAPWIVIRHPAKFVANCLRNNIPAGFSGFEDDPEFEQRFGNAYAAMRAYAEDPSHLTPFHQNLIYWMMCANVTLKLAEMWGPHGAYAVNLLDSINSDPVPVVASSLRRCGCDFSDADVAAALGRAAGNRSIGSLDKLQQSADVLSPPDPSEELRPLTPEMLKEVEVMAGELYRRLEDLELSLSKVAGNSPG